MKLRPRDATLLVNYYLTLFNRWICTHVYILYIDGWIVSSWFESFAREVRGFELGAPALQDELTSSYRITLLRVESLYDFYLGKKMFGDYRNWN